MPAPASVPEFLDIVRRSALLPDARLDDVIDRHRATGTLPGTVDQIASLLVRESLLTFFQAKQLKLGRYKRFTIGSKYRLLELIGAGGMGAVYLCEHTLMRRLVALKVLPVEKLEDKSNEERFYREARAVAALDHPNIVRAYDIDHYEKLHFLVMEYVDGASLQEVVARYAMEKRLFDPVRVAHYIAQAAVGMQHGHELGMVHRDIKPGNLLLDRTGVIKVLDMGLARFFNKQQDSVTEKYDDKCVLGTADYLAPEQAVSNMVDIRADVYALGGTLYFMLTAQTPFPEGTIASKLVAHQTREPRPVEAFRPDVPPGMLAVLRRMMAKDPRARYQTPIEVAEALSEWAEQPITPPPAREMPVHCPLVQALAAPSMTGSGSGSPLARVLFGGRGVFGRTASGGSGSGRVGGSDPKLGGGVGTASYPGGAGSSPSYNGDVPLNGPVSTSRASSSPTGPLPAVPPASNSGFPTAVPGLGDEPARRTWLYAAIGVLLVLLFVLAAVAAYYIGRNDTKPQPQPPAGQKPPQDEEPVRAPTTAEPALSPAQAAGLAAGTEVLVQFDVRTVDGRSVLRLSAAPDPASRWNFAVNLLPPAYQHARMTPAQVAAEYEGKTVRVRGRLVKDAETSTAGIDVATMNQLLTVP
jgi:serine/threonine protein kinase